MAHLRAYVGSSWRSCSPSCLSCSPSWRCHGQQFEAKCHLRANIIEDSPQDASATPCKHPKTTKKQRKPKVFQCFSLSCHGTKIDQRCSQYRFRSSQVESKMAILPLAWLILKLMLAHLGGLARHLASLVRHLGADMASNSKQNAIFEPTSSKTAPKMPQPPLPSTPKVQKNKENLMFFSMFFTLKPWCQNRSKMLPEPLQKLPS